MRKQCLLEFHDLLRAVDRVIPVRLYLVVAHGLGPQDHLVERLRDEEGVVNRIVVEQDALGRIKKITAAPEIIQAGDGEPADHPLFRRLDDAPFAVGAHVGKAGMGRHEGDDAGIELPPPDIVDGLVEVGEQHLVAIGDHQLFVGIDMVDRHEARADRALGRGGDLHDIGALRADDDLDDVIQAERFAVLLLDHEGETRLPGDTEQSAQRVLDERGAADIHERLREDELAFREVPVAPCNRDENIHCGAPLAIVSNAVVTRS